MNDTLMNEARMNRPVLILAGGTGGHIFPGLSVAAALQARGVPVSWLGADGGMETRLVPQQGIAIDTIAVKGLRGKGIIALLAAPLRVAAAVFAALRVVRARDPRAVVSFGGYAAGPGGIAARLRGIPLVVHEQNRAAGMTNRVLARFAQRVLTGFPQTFEGVDADTVGNPVRDTITALPPPARRFQMRSGAVQLLVLGGSQGARALNTAVPKALAAIAEANAQENTQENTQANQGGVHIQVRHQCGEKLREEAEQAYAQAGIEASVEPFIADMAAAYADADLVVCRAGALTLAELCAASAMDRRCAGSASNDASTACRRTARWSPCGSSCAAPCSTRYSALRVWWSSTACGNGTRTLPTPAAHSSARVSAPARHTTRSASA